MSAAKGWAGEPALPPVTPTPAPVVEATPARERIDLDQVQAAVWALAGAALTLAGTVAGAYLLGRAFGGWVGALLVLGVGLLISGYSLVKATERRNVRDRLAAEAAFRGDQPGPGGTSTYTVPTLD